MKMNADMSKEEKESISDSFKSELKDLLKKYNASIEFESYEGSEKMNVWFFVEKGSRTRDHYLEKNLTTKNYIEHMDL